ncbi:hypothetical protein AURDEDRAFT_153238 [Auricularia subglabra TFB-10046 SS5]|uniref:UBC core domain-containing protein n=1 Tax=Auricularia subglabra (strain TFB-10046 / SS5) TaxID=717982 RepID=J0D2P3_AURST|nr:hypothetical protein AURDEDRAFT_153238 [Auricularia subglabra TFB-10046 SS5]
MVASAAVRAAHLRARVLVDLAELREQTLPGFSVHFDDADTSRICLVVEPVEGHLAGLKLHFEVELPPDFPLVPLKVKNSTKLDHPNVFGDWICLDILKTEEEMQWYRTADYTGGYTPAYSILGVLQQVASFFGTDKIPQSDNRFVNVTPEGGYHRRRIAMDGARAFRCARCPYAPAEPSDSQQHVLKTVPDWIKPGAPRRVRPPPPAPPAVPGASLLERDRTVVGFVQDVSKSRRKALRKRRAKAQVGTSDVVLEPVAPSREPTPPTPSDLTLAPSDDDLVEAPPRKPQPCFLDRLNEDVLLHTFAFMPTSDLLSFAQAYPFASTLCAAANVVAAREIRCFVTKKRAGETVLGVGLAWNARLKGLESSFDLLAREAFLDLGIRMGLRREPFTHWLPLAVNGAHFARARPEAVRRLRDIERQLVLGPGKGGAGRREPSVDGYRALCSFANEIVVRLMKTADEVLAPPPRAAYSGCGSPDCRICQGSRGKVVKKSVESTSPAGTLLHASEKALCDFVSVVHLAAALAVANPAVAQDAQRAVARFVRYPNARHKDATPDLGELLVQAALCDAIGWEELRGPLVQESLTRSVVWMLDRQQGRGLAGLAHLEADAVSEWRLRETFRASRTGLRLLMFQRLFLAELPSLGLRDPDTGRMTLRGLKEGLDAHYGLPPREMPARLVQGIKEIYAVDNFAAYAARLGLRAPSKSWMTNYLRDRVRESQQKGYHRVPVSLDALVRVRAFQDPEWAERTETRRRMRASLRKCDQAVSRSFFPNRFSGATR